MLIIVLLLLLLLYTLLSHIKFQRTPFSEENKQIDNNTSLLYVFIFTFSNMITIFKKQKIENVNKKTKRKQTIQMNMSQNAHFMNSEVQLHFIQISHSLKCRKTDEFFFVIKRKQKQHQQNYK